MKILVCALMVLALAPAAIAHEITGVVVRTDAPAHVVMLDDGRMFRVRGDHAILVNDQPVMLETLQPGTHVVIRTAEPVALRDGTYVVVAEPAALPQAVVVETPRVISEPQVRGTISRVDMEQGIVWFEDGRIVQIGPRTVALVDGRPVQLIALRPGLHVVLTAINPVVFRNGRHTLLNEGFRDDSGSTLAPAIDFAGYEADIDHAGMQIQS